MVEKIKKIKKILPPVKKTVKGATKAKAKTKAKPKARLKVQEKIKLSPTTKKVTPIHLKRSTSNPIIKPSHYPNWESQATFNPSAIYHDGKVHIVYRAIGIGDTSVLGYAQSDDGITISKRSPLPIYYEAMNKKKDMSVASISYISGGGGYGGCEDPRLTLIGDTVYMLYIAFDGWGSVRIALTSISLNDFITSNWDWKPSVLISAPGQIQKNWVLFPEKINGKYAILHAISPEIMIDYIENMDEFDGTTYIQSLHQHDPRWQLRDKGIRGVGPAPIKTKDGWLVLYHAMQEHDPNRYKLWAMILDLKDPTKVLYRSKEAILEPDEYYENEGYKSGVVYSCGAIVKDENLFVYYGGADMVSCVAVADLNAFLKELTKKGGVPKLSTKSKRKNNT